MIRRIRPVSRIFKIETEINRSGAGPFFRKHELPGWDQLWVPAVDIYEKDNEVVVEVELPGVLQKDIRILLYGTRIEVIGRKEENPAESNMRFHRLERAYGRFRRMILIPSAIVPEKTSASLENGILTIVLKKHPKQGREVEVKIRKRQPQD